MQLTPLRYPRMIYLGGQLQTPPMYGRQYYETACHRFRLTKITSSEWIIESGEWSWSEWLNKQGLLYAPFAIRRDALEALNNALVGETLMDAKTPN